MPGGGEAESGLGGVSGDVHSFSAIRQNSTISDESVIHAWIKTSETLANRLTDFSDPVMRSSWLDIAVHVRLPYYRNNTNAGLSAVLVQRRMQGGRPVFKDTDQSERC
jgi:hypothetical protein